MDQKTVVENDTENFENAKFDATSAKEDFETDLWSL